MQCAYALTHLLSPTCTLIADNSLVCGRMQLVLEEVLQIITLPQLRSAVAFARYLTELIKTNEEILRRAENSKKQPIVS